MRLTLRTLLAYLDDALEAPQAKAIGKKIAESEMATELIDRIRKVTRRRRLTAPPESGPGAGIDANTIAAYLDNDVSSEQQSEVEEICLSSDFHLAEVAACHQILTLVLTEPATVPPSAKERMYDLAKGKEAVVRPAPKKEKAPDVVPADEKDADEKIRMGLPFFDKEKASKWLFVGGGFLAACLLGFVIWQFLSWDSTDEPGPTPIVGAKPKPPAPKPDPKKDKQSKTKKDDKKKETPKPKEKTKSNGEKPKPKEKDKKPKAKPPETKGSGEIPYAPPRPEFVPIAEFESAPVPNDTLVQLDKNNTWRRLNVRNSTVVSNRPLVSLPGRRSIVKVGDKFRLTLWGELPEVWVFSLPIPPLFESAVELHPNSDFGLDLTLKRGRIVIGNLQQEGTPRVRLRLDDPTNPVAKQYFDFTFETPGAELMAELVHDIPPGEPFFKDPDDPKRKGPFAFLFILAKNGEIFVNRNNLGFRLSAPPSNAAFYIWNSVQGDSNPIPLNAIPKTLENPPIPPNVDKDYRREMLKATEDFSGELIDTKPVPILVAEWLKAPPNHFARRDYAVRCLAALSSYEYLLDALQTPKYPRVRREAIDAIRRWIARERDNEYLLFDVLQKKYNTTQAERMMDLLHNYSKEALQSSDTYQVLIDLLNDTQLVVRELAYWHLHRLVPAGRSVPYSAAAESVSRQQAQAAWRKLIPRGQLPPTAKPAPTP